MKIKIIFFLILGLGISGTGFAQSANPSIGSESSSRGVWPSVDSGNGYGSSDHGNVS